MKSKFAYALFSQLLFFSALFGEFYSKELAPIPNWSGSVFLEPTAPQRAKTAILIIAPLTYGEHPILQRWKLGETVWKKYMNSHPDVDCFFITCAAPRRDSGEEVWLEGNRIYVGDPWTEKTGCDRLLHKTIKALEWLEGKYTHFIRTNINTFFDLNNVARFSESHSMSFFSTPIWQTAWYTIGYSICFSADVAKHMVSEYNRLDALDEELISPYHADDGAITALATGVWPYDHNHPFTCCETLPRAVRQLLCEASYSTERHSRYGALITPVHSLEEAIYYFDTAGSETVLYRTRDGLSLKELEELYKHMLKKTYPELGAVDLLEG